MSRGRVVRWRGAIAVAALLAGVDLTRKAVVKVSAAYREAQRAAKAR
jgi:hypothetical protein